MNMNRSITTISRKGQITLPKQLREGLKLEPGDRVEVVMGEGYLIIRPVTPPSEGLRGLAKGLLDQDSVEYIRQLRREDLEEL